MATKPKDTEFTEIELMQKDAPDVRFRGKLLGEIDSRSVDDRQRARDSDRYTKLELYELESGKWIAAKIACSDRPGEVDIATIETVPANQVFEDVYVDKREPLPVEERQKRVLEAFGWTWLAKAFADKMGWDHVQELA